MYKGKVTKDASQVKLVLNGVPEGIFDIDEILSSLELNCKAFCITMMREVILGQFLNAHTAGEKLWGMMIRNELQGMSGLEHTADRIRA